MEVEQTQTKARTKGERLRDKRRRFIRPRDVLAEREPSGRIQRKTAAETRFEILATALSARRRHFGLSEEDARDPRAGYELGRLYLKWEGSPRKGLFTPGVTQAQHDAGKKYAETYEKHLRAISAPPPRPKAPGPSTSKRSIFDMFGDKAEDQRAQTYRRWIEAWCIVRKRLDESGREIGLVGREIRAAVEVVCIHDAPAKDLRALKFGLWTLADYFKIRY